MQQQIKKTNPVDVLEVELTNHGSFSDRFFGIRKLRCVNKGKLFSFFRNIEKKGNIKNILMRGLGDPMHHPDFLEIAKFFLGRGINLSIFTFPENLKHYTRLFGYGNKQLSYVIYHYPGAVGYASSLQEMGRNAPLMRTAGALSEQFKDIFIADDSNLKDLERALEAKNVPIKPVGIIKVLNGDFLSNKTASTVIDLHARFGVHRSIHWEQGRNTKSQCSYMRNTRLFINSGNSLSYCHFLSHLENTQLKKIDQNPNLEEVFEMYKKQLIWRQAAVKEEKLFSSARFHVSPCDYCWKYFETAR